MLINASFFTQNRRNFTAQLQPNSVVVITAYGQMQRGIDSAYNFEQEANFWYLTGIDAPDWRLIIDVDRGDEWLVMPDIDPVQQVFMGSLSADAAKKASGVASVLTAKAGDAKIAALVAKKAQVYTIAPQNDEHIDFYLNPAQAELSEQLAKSKKLVDARRLLAKQRAIKQAAELEAIQSAIDVSIDGILTTLPQVAACKYEYEVEAKLTYEFRMRGADGHAYDPIIAGGKNACTLHYGANNAALHKKDWLLFDVGARHNGYCADITRTIPLGKPTDRQLQVYDAVQRVHDVAMSLCKPGQSTREYVQKVDEAMAKELVRLKLITSEKDEARHTYFPHAVSHGLGIDVHDSLGGPKEFAENMVLTVEPGIYIPAENLGIRLENDIRITKDGPKNLCERLPSDIENLQKLLY